MDYGRPVEFGLFVTPSAAALENCFALAQLADGRVEFLGVQDHPYQQAFVDTFTLIGSLLERTDQVRVFPDVANLPLRPPAVLAQAAATLDLLSGGRFELGLGAGAFWPAIEAMGGPARTPGEAAGALKEAVEVIRLMWSGERSVRFSGEHYRLAGVHPGPRPAHDIGIWLGVGGPKLLRHLGGHADGWAPSNSFFPPETLPERHAAIDDGARAAGRDPASIRRLYNIFGSIDDARSDEPFHGTVEQWTERLTGLVVETGMDTFVFGAEDDDYAQCRRFVEEVAPAVRQRVAEVRAGG
ncbi:N5,N10-methylene tetrahydromethanopterin reductase [Tsukamurella pulmonis]|uniref:Luciferase-like monooxygenase n=1 Tax=Tsukamurella pulmonis TaxID=47312 RepID=A0A1H1GPM9_9ACTN|nr:LLM class flavin-dependent oxidoreductase [Tsukamurella pulmonis]KXO88325.1 N5,N10-methylene tetrahydromethanopterin reductase [Tsukamurella pulmonis]SDR15137.1 Luciferase-like monooxygenase [Tsukamurella pulmonis]SUP16897.1 F420-dependent glucose-6-phosphate dehydrogenase [Tsukamurella pulmonis]